MVSFYFYDQLTPLSYTNRIALYILDFHFVVFSNASMQQFSCSNNNLSEIKLNKKWTGRDSSIHDMELCR